MCHLLSYVLYRDFFIYLSQWRADLVVYELIEMYGDDGIVASSQGNPDVIKTITDQTMTADILS